MCSRSFFKNLKRPYSLSACKGVARSKFPQSSERVRPPDSGGRVVPFQSVAVGAPVALVAAHHASMNSWSRCCRDELELRAVFFWMSLTYDDGLPECYGDLRRSMGCRQHQGCSSIRRLHTGKNLTSSYENILTLFPCIQSIC